MIEVLLCGGQYQHRMLSLDSFEGEGESFISTCT